DDCHRAGDLWSRVAHLEIGNASQCCREVMEGSSCHPERGADAGVAGGGVYGSGGGWGDGLELDHREAVVDPIVERGFRSLITDAGRKGDAISSVAAARAGDDV